LRFLTSSSTFGCVLALALATVIGVAAGTQAAEVTAETGDQDTARRAERSFATDVWPLLKAKCIACHGGDADDIKGELDLRSRAGLLRGGESGEPAVRPGRPGKSLLLQAVRWEGYEMPPKANDRLTIEQIRLIERWISDGAPWPDEDSIRRFQNDNWQRDDRAAGVRVHTSGGQSQEWSNRRYDPQDLWAYRPVERREVPNSIADDAERVHPVDAFINRRLAEAKIAAAPDADDRTLIRRTTYDLTGLPPTPEQIDSYLADESPDKHGRLIERLLDSRQYGEQMARRWLDVVRYADSAGFSNDFMRPHAWRYRDYVVRSFNADKPYDQFLIEQLAGDELRDGGPEQLLATGFLRMGPWEHTSMSVAAVTRQQFLDDVTNSVGEVFLGQVLRCCKCHDHKFDPLPTRDYYRMQALFAPMQIAHRQVPFQAHEHTDSLDRLIERSQKMLDQAEARLADLKQKQAAANDARQRDFGTKSLIELPPEARIDPNYIGLDDREKGLRKVLQKRVEYFRRELTAQEPLALGVYNGPLNVRRTNALRLPVPPAAQRTGETQAIYVLAGGALEARGEEVSPGVLSLRVAPHTNPKERPPAETPQTLDGRRLALARWMLSADNPLTARVIVNRIWQQHFGDHGLVRTPNNFGKTGSKPTHPQLLDFLATWLVDHGWSIKKLHRLIMTSSAYRRASRHADQSLRQRDPDNELLAVYPVRRLAAEEIRDSLLSVTGELNLEPGGPPAYPEINWQVALQPRHVMGSVAPAYQPHATRAERHRRSLYTVRIRTLRDPLLEVFNQPGSEQSCERRDETTVTPQVFTLWNGAFAHDRALALAVRVSSQADDIGERVDLAFRLALGRSATESQRELAIDHIRRMTERHRRHSPEALRTPRVVMRSMIEEMTGEPVAWEETLDLMEEFQPDTKPSDVSPETRGLSELCLVLLNSNEFVYVY